MKEKLELLSSMSAQLKKEFVGIDEVIDKVVKSITPWYVMPELIDRPVIINLWGLTGTGKTSLVKRITEILDHSNVLVFDMGDNNPYKQSIRDVLEDISEDIDEIENSPIIILDEFQYARTINEDKEEIDKPYSRAIWDLIDSGKLNVNSFNYRLFQCISNSMYDLKLAMTKGITITDGIIDETFKKEFFDLSYYSSDNYIDNRDSKPRKTNGLNAVTKKSNDESLEEEKEYTIIASDLFNQLGYVNRDLFTKFKEFYFKCSSLEDLDKELFRISKEINRPKVIDCSKSVIFILGNLDEAYPMHSDFNPDIDADEYYEMTKKININDIKSCLRRRFRSEQIARLGNNHIIYPSLKHYDFEKIIDLVLNKIKDKYSVRKGINITFDDSIRNLLYSEAIYPVQGVRPIYATINDMISSKLPEVTLDISLNYNEVDEILCISKGDLFSDGVDIEFIYTKNKKIISSISIYQELVLGKLRKGSNKAEQTIAAVHESGHAIVYAKLFHKLPNSIVSVSSIGGGFMSRSVEDSFGNKEILENDVATGLAGLCAEKVVFGESNVTFGASSDLSKITEMVINSYYLYGLYKPMKFWNKHSNSFNGTPIAIPDDNENCEIIDEIQVFIANIESMTTRILIEEKELLKNMSLYLSEHREMSKEIFNEMISKYGIYISIDSTSLDNKYIDLLSKF